LQQHKINTKTKARFSHLLRHPAWKWRGPILVLVLHKFVTYLLAYLNTYPLTYSPGPTQGREQKALKRDQTSSLHKSSTACIQGHGGHTLAKPE